MSIAPNVRYGSKLRTLTSKPANIQTVKDFRRTKRFEDVLKGEHSGVFVKWEKRRKRNEETLGDN